MSRYIGTLKTRHFTSKCQKQDSESSSNRSCLVPWWSQIPVRSWRSEVPWRTQCFWLDVRRCDVYLFGPMLTSISREISEYVCHLVCQHAWENKWEEKILSWSISEVISSSCVSIVVWECWGEVLWQFVTGDVCQLEICSNCMTFKLLETTSRFVSWKHTCTPELISEFVSGFHTSFCAGHTLCSILRLPDCFVFFLVDIRRSQEKRTGLQHFMRTPSRVLYSSALFCQLVGIWDDLNPVTVSVSFFPKLFAAQRVCQAFIGLLKFIRSTAWESSGRRWRWVFLGHHFKCRSGGRFRTSCRCGERAWHREARVGDKFSWYHGWPSQIYIFSIFLPGNSFSWDLKRSLWIMW